MPTADRVLLVVEPIRTTRTFEAAIEHLTEAIERSGLLASPRMSYVIRQLISGQDSMVVLLDASG